MENCAMDVCEMQDASDTMQEVQAIQKCNTNRESQEVPEFLHWNEKIGNMRKSLLAKGTWSMESLTESMQLYVRYIRTTVTEYDSKHLQAVRLKDSITETLMLFLYIYRNISGVRSEGVYFAAMSDMMALYFDLELKLSKMDTEELETISARITSTFYVYLGNSAEHLLETLIKVQFMYACYRNILDPVISKIIRTIPRRPESGPMYTRYFLVYCLWRKINIEKVAKHQITAMAASSLGLLPSTFPPHILRNILPKVPNTQPNTAVALMDYKFDLRKCCDTFLRTSERNLQTLNRTNMQSHDIADHSTKNPLAIIKPEDLTTINGDNVKSRNAFRIILNKSEKSCSPSNAFNVDAQSSFKHVSSLIDVSAKHSSVRSIKLRTHILRRKRKNHKDIVIIDLTSDIALEKCIKKRKYRKITWLDEAKKRICARMLKPKKRTDVWEHNPPHASLIRKINKTSPQDQSTITNISEYSTSTEEYAAKEFPNDGSKDILCTVERCTSSKSSTIGVVQAKEKESEDLNGKELSDLRTCKTRSEQMSGIIPTVVQQPVCNHISSSLNDDCVSSGINHNKVNSTQRNHKTAENSNVTELSVEMKSPELFEDIQAINDFKQLNPDHMSCPVEVGVFNNMNINTVTLNTSLDNDASEKIVSASTEECSDGNKTLANNEVGVSTNHSEHTNCKVKQTVQFDRNKEMYSSIKRILSKYDEVKQRSEHEQVNSDECYAKSKDDEGCGEIEKSNVTNAKHSYNAKETTEQSYFIYKSKFSKKTKESVHSESKENEETNKLLEFDETRRSIVTLDHGSISAVNHFSYCDGNNPDGQQYHNEKSYMCDYAKDLRNKFKTVMSSDVTDTLQSNNLLQNIEIRDDIDGLSLLASVSQQVPHLSPLQETNRNHLMKDDPTSVRKTSCNLSRESDASVSYKVTSPTITDVSSNDIISKIVGTQSGNVFGKVAVQLEVRSVSDPVIVENSEYGSRSSILRCPDFSINYDGENLSHIPSNENTIHSEKENTNVILNGETVVLLQKSPNSNLYIINKAVENVKDSNNDDEANKSKEKSWLSHHDLAQLDISTVDPMLYASDLLYTNKVCSYQDDKLLPVQNRAIKIEPDEISLSNIVDLKASIQKNSLVNDILPSQQQTHTADATTLNLSMSTEKRKSSKSKIVFRQNIKQEFSNTSNHISDSNAQGYVDLLPHRNEIDLHNSHHVSVTHSMSNLPPIYGNYSGSTDLCVLCHKHCATLSCNLQINSSASLYAHKTNPNNTCRRAHCACLNCGYDIVARCRKCVPAHSATDTHAPCAENKSYFLSTHSSVQTPAVQEHDNSKSESVEKFYDDPLYCKVEKNFFRKASTDEFGKQCVTATASEREIDNKLPLKKRLKAHTMMAMMYKEIQIKTENTTHCSLVPTSSTNIYSVPNNSQYEGTKHHISPESLKLSLINKDEKPLDFTPFDQRLLGAHFENPIRQTCQIRTETHDHQARPMNDLCNTPHMETAISVPDQRKRICQENTCKKLKKSQPDLKQIRSSKRNVPKVNYCYTDIDPEWSPSSESKRKRRKSNR